jgi:hypothetical protein
MPTRSKPRRRTQEDRRNATRGALLDATVACLIEYGYRGRRLDLPPLSAVKRLPRGRP